MGICIKKQAKRLIALLLVAVTLCSNATVSFAAEETINQIQGGSATKTYYRYREKTYTTATEELKEPWILYNQEQVVQHGETFNVYLDDDEVIDQSKYCVHGKIPTCKYHHQTNSTIKYVDSTLTDHEYYYSNGSDQNKLYWHYGDCYRYVVCAQTSKTTKTKYYYYKWSDWSEWGETPITETEDCQVEIRYVYTVSYDANGGEEVPQAQSKIENENITITEDIPVREGYSFVGWSTSVDGDIEYNPGDTYSSNSSITLYAIWEANTYIVSFDANGGSNAPPSQTKTHNADLIISNEVPAREGYLFLGWSTTPGGGVCYQPGSICKENTNVLLYAVWSSNKYTITYDANGGINAPASQVKEHNIDLTISYQAPTRDTYNFLGWATTLEGDVTYVPGAVYSQNISITLYAKWELIEQDVSSIIAYGTCGDNLVWELSDLGVLTVDGTGEMAEWAPLVWNIPWYSYREQIRAVIISDGVESVSDSAFSCCYNLDYVALGDTVRRIGDSAFDYASINSIVIPNSVTEIGSAAFFGCSNLTDVYFNGSVSLFSATFEECSILSIHIPDIETWLRMEFDFLSANPLYYGGSLFIDEEIVTDIIVPQTITSIPWYAFAGYDKLTSIVLPDTITQIGGYAFFECGGLAEIKIPESISTFEERAFSYTFLKSIIIPTSVTSISPNTFEFSVPENVYYCGTEVQWNSMNIEDEYLLMSNIHTVDSMLQFSGASLTLHNNLAISYKVDTALFESFGYTQPYVIFEFNGIQTTVTKYTTDGGRYVFTFCDIAPNQMNDTISATLFATYDGVEYSSETKEYSVATYCYNMLEKCSGDEYAEFRTLLVDLLHYGAASQVYTNYKTDALVDAQLTATQLSWGTSSDRTLENVLDTTYETVADPSVVWKGAGLNLQDSVTVRLKFETADIEGLSLRIICQTGSWEIWNDAFESAGDVYYAYFRGLNAGQMSEPIYMTFYRDNTPVSNTVCYSIESYAQANQNGGTTALVELLKAMMRYGDSAYAYVN